MELSVVILNYDSEAFLARCLESIRRDRVSPDPELVVVDNGSKHVQAVRRICGSFDVDRVIENRTNLGVAAARNQGVRASNGELICTLDVDTIVTSGAFSELAKMARSPAAGVCGPQLRSPDGELQYTCRRFPTICTKMLRLMPRYDLFGALPFEEMRDTDHAFSMPVDWVIGACQCYSRAVFEELRGYTVFSRFGFEDVDFCLRAWLSGRCVHYVPSAVIFHDEQRVARGRNRALTVSHLLSLVRYFRTHSYGLSRKRLYGRIAQRNSHATADWESSLANLAAALSTQAAETDKIGSPDAAGDHRQTR